MAGFPAESEEAFENSFRFAEEMGFAKIHVFRYSPRPGTAAASLPDSVPEPVKAARSKRLIRLSAEMGCRFAESQTGRVLDVLVEEFDPETGVASGLSPNYLRVSFEARTARRGAIVPVRAEKAAGEGIRGSVVENQSQGAEDVRLCFLQDGGEGNRPSDGL